MTFHCTHCWENPCVCGHEYEALGYSHRFEIMAGLLGFPETEMDGIKKRYLELKKPYSLVETEVYDYQVGAEDFAYSVFIFKGRFDEVVAVNDALIVEALLAGVQEHGTIWVNRKVLYPR